MIRKSMPSDLIRWWVPVFPRDKREAFARRSCSNKKIERDDDSKKSHPTLGGIVGVIPPIMARTCRICYETTLHCEGPGGPRRGAGAYGQVLCHHRLRRKGRLPTKSPPAPPT